MNEQESEYQRIGREQGLIPLAVSSLDTVADLIAALQQMDPELPVRLNREQKIASVDQRGDVVWVNDVRHSPLGWIADRVEAK